MATTPVENTTSVMVKLPPAMFQQVERKAESRGVTPSIVLEEILKDFHAGNLVPAKEAGAGTFFDEIYHYLGNNHHNKFASALHEVLKGYRKNTPLPNDKN